MIEEEEEKIMNLIYIYFKIRKQKIIKLHVFLITQSEFHTSKSYFLHIILFLFFIIYIY